MTYSEYYWKTGNDYFKNVWLIYLILHRIFVVIVIIQRMFLFYNTHIYGNITRYLVLQI